MPKYHFITFATPDFMSFAEENVKSALSIGGFDTAKIYTMDDIDDYFKSKNAHILNQPRGSGYWLWKPYIIMTKILEVPEGDIVCYNDSKYLWLKNVRELEKLVLSEQNIGIFINKPKGGLHYEKQFTKLDAFAIMYIPHGSFRDYIKNTYQAWAGLVLIRKSFNPILFFGEWLTYSKDPRIITDNKSIFGSEDKEFKENRHDQTVLSLLSKKWEIPMNNLNDGYLLDLRNV